MGIICCNVECGVCDKCYVEKTEKSLHKRFDGQEDLITDFQALHIMDSHIRRSNHVWYVVQWYKMLGVKVNYLNLIFHQGNLFT